MKKLKELVSREEISEVLLKDGQTYFLKTAENLSYPALAFVANLYYAPNGLFDDEFAQDSPIFQTFIQKLKECTLEDFEIMRLLMSLLKFNYVEVEKAVLNSGDSRLIKALYGIMKKYAGLFQDYPEEPFPILNEKGENIDSSE